MLGFYLYRHFSLSDYEIFEVELSLRLWSLGDDTFKGMNHRESFCFDKDTQRIVGRRVLKFFKILFTLERFGQMNSTDNGWVAERVCKDVSWFQIRLNVLLLNKLPESCIFISAHGPCSSVCCKEANTQGFFNELAELRCVKTRRITDRTSVL